MIAHNPGVLLEIRGSDVESIARDLDAAVLLTQSHAKECGHGILVTQRGFDSYTVAVSPDVPYGETRERRDWPSTRPFG